MPKHRYKNDTPTATSNTHNIIIAQNTEHTPTIILLSFLLPAQRPMPPLQEEETTFTLSFGGVEFCLAPSPTDDASAANDHQMSVSKICNGEVLINLNNFVGTLRVKNQTKMEVDVTASEALPATESLMENDGDNMSIDIEELPSQNDQSDAVAPNPVEDVPSPQAKSCEEDKPAEKPKQRKGQQKLNFFGKHGKKQGQKSQVCFTVS